MGWREDLEVGTFVIVAGSESWTIELVTRTSHARAWVSSRDGGKDIQFTRSWGHEVGGYRNLVEWTEEAEAKYLERDARQARFAAEEKEMARLYAKRLAVRQIDWSEATDDMLDAVLRLAGKES